MLSRRPLAFSTGVLASVLLLAGCASTATKQIQLDPEVVEAEEHRQRQLAIKSVLQQQERLDDIAHPILAAAVPLCQEDVAPRAGFRFGNRHDFENEWARAAEDALGLGDTVQITGVTATSPAEESALRVGDRIVALNGEPAPVGDDATEALGERLSELQQSKASGLTLTVSRDGALHDVKIQLEQMCHYPARVVRHSTLNAFADGDQIYVTTSMMRFATDYELSTIVAHELAHNAMDHIEKQQKNTIFGAILGAVVDVAAAAAGYNTGGVFTSEGAKLGSITHSQDFEREADYVGLYAMALAGLPLDSAPQLWRHMAQQNPEQISFAGTHPTSAERFVRMARAIEEIQYKQENNLALRPEMKTEEDNRQLERALAAGGEEQGQVDTAPEAARDVPDGDVAGLGESGGEAVRPAIPEEAEEDSVEQRIQPLKTTPTAESDTLAIYYSEYTNPWLKRWQFKRDRQICKNAVCRRIVLEPGTTEDQFEKLVRRCLAGKGWRRVTRQ